jgi:hypothetical protein
MWGRIIASVLFAALAAAPLPAQRQLTDNTVALSPGRASPPATVAAAWLAGHWTGEALGGVAEEVWTPARDGEMLGMYRLSRDGSAVMYELMTLAEADGTLLLRIKHFGRGLVGREALDEAAEFPLVGAADGLLQFAGLTIRREGDDAVTVFVALGAQEGSPREAAFRYRRVRPALGAGPR